jgi:hypothetical protein
LHSLFCKVVISAERTIWNSFLTAPWSSALTSDVVCCGHYGFGKYAIVDDVIELTLTGNQSEFASTYEVTDSLGGIDRIVFQMQSKTSEPIEFVNITLRHKAKRRLSHMVSSNAKGEAVLRNLPHENWNEYSVEVSEFGLNALTIPLSEVARKSVRVMLTGNTALTHGKLFFNFEEDGTGVKIIGPYFNNERKRRVRERNRKARVIFTIWPWRWKRAWNYRHEIRPIIFSKS